ncbi:MAG TPA: BREX-3 system P-loop-containing protein BrxF [Anaerolineaceae bacterium]|nr:BREX-3 system P-loop-containing protein BrxF [Anaerolineaceae bacterium]
MAETALDKLKEALRIVVHNRHKLVILLGDFGSGKTALLKQLAAELPAEYVNLNLELTERLLTRPRRDYADGVTAHALIDMLCDERSPDGRTLLIDNVEILLSPELGKLNPVDTFKRVARQRSVVLALPGQRHGETAEYSVMGREDYFRIPLEDYPVVELH